MNESAKEPPSSNVFAKPKSASFTTPEDENNVLEGFKSLKKSMICDNLKIYYL
jgi:hypothetical protein